MSWMVSLLTVQKIQDGDIYLQQTCDHLWLDNWIYLYNIVDASQLYKPWFQKHWRKLFERIIKTCPKKGRGNWRIVFWIFCWVEEESKEYGGNHKMYWLASDSEAVFICLHYFYIYFQTMLLYVKINAHIVSVSVGM